MGTVTGEWLQLAALTSITPPSQSKAQQSKAAPQALLLRQVFLLDRPVNNQQRAKKDLCSLYNKFAQTNTAITVT